jgi:hypothetical protein
VHHSRATSVCTRPYVCTLVCTRPYVCTDHCTSLHVSVAIGALLLLIGVLVLLATLPHGSLCSCLQARASVELVGSPSRLCVPTPQLALNNCCTFANGRSPNNVPIHSGRSYDWPQNNGLPLTTVVPINGLPLTTVFLPLTTAGPFGTDL